MKRNSDLPVKVFATGGAREIASNTVDELKECLPERFIPSEGLKLGSHKVKKFSNNEFLVQPENVRGHFVVILHTRSNEDIHEDLMELFWLSDAIRNAGVEEENVLVAFPYMPYSRSDKKDQSRIPAPSSFLARVINKVCKFRKVLLIEPHDDHICHYFDPYAKHLSTENLMIEMVKREILEKYSKEELVFTFPDSGAAKRYGKIPEILSVSSAYIDKIRKCDEIRCKEVIGDIKDKICIFVDDEVCSGRTIINNAELVKKRGAKAIVAIITHATLSRRDKENSELMYELEHSPVDSFVITDSLPVREKIAGRESFTLLTISGLLAQAIRHVVAGRSLSSFYDLNKVKEYYRPPKIPIGELL